MKNLKLLFGFLIVATIIWACQDDSNDNIQNSNAANEANFARPANAINYKELVLKLNQYDITRKKILENALGYEDTRINYYSIEQLENYLGYVKQLAREKGIEVTGVNFISATYPADYKEVPEYANRQTMVLMPTTTIDGENVSFDPLHSTKEKVVTFKEMLAKYGYHWRYDKNKKGFKENVKILFNKNTFNKAQDIESSGANRNNVTPPPYNDNPPPYNND